MDLTSSAHIGRENCGLERGCFVLSRFPGMDFLSGGRGRITESLPLHYLPPMSDVRMPG
jgi:hypothetical protein